MSGFDLFLFVVKAFLLSHLVLIALVVGGVALVLSIVFLGTGPAVLGFLRSRIGQLIIALVLAGTAGWELKGYVDDSVALQRQLVADRREADRVLAEEKARTAAALAAAAEARRQAEAQRAIAATAAERETQARTEADALQEQVDDLNDHFAAAPTGDKHRFVLSADDARRLRGVGATAGSRKP